MASHQIIAIGGSAGAFESLVKILRGLPPRFPAAILAVIHTAPDNPGRLSTILSRVGSLPAEAATDGVPMQPGRVYVAPPDHHLLVKDGRLQITRGPREHGFRPALDPLFRTAAAAYGPRVIAIILSGAGSDGLLGLSLVKRGGGIVSSRRIRTTRIFLACLSARFSRSRRPYAARGRYGVRLFGSRQRTMMFPLFTLSDRDLLRFQCYVGHTYGPDSLAAAQADDLEQALWTAIRALEESSTLRRRMAAHARDRGLTAIAEEFDEHAQDSESRAKLVRRVIATPADTKVESS